MKTHHVYFAAFILTVAVAVALAFYMPLLFGLLGISARADYLILAHVLVIAVFGYLAIRLLTGSIVHYGFSYAPSLFYSKVKKSGGDALQHNRLLENERKR